MDTKKISFGFNKTSKKNILVSNKFNEKPDTKIDLITHLEGKSIKLLDEKPVEKPLIIPLVDGRKTSAALASLQTRHNVLNANEVDAAESTEKTDSDTLPQINPNETLEEKAARELLQEVKGEECDEKTNTTLTVVPKPEELPLEGASEATLDDYENIPITQFGLAMLRGMGWKDEEHKKKANAEDPVVRPKGMGLGADKVITKKPPLVPPEPNEKLIIKKEAYVRILGGKHKDLYGQIEGLDDHAGRVIIRMALGGTQESLNEFMVQPVSKGEYAKYSKVINSAKYEEYKRMENEHGQIIIKDKNQLNDDQNASLENKIIKEEPRQIKVEKIEKHSRYKSPNRHEDAEQHRDIKRLSEDERSRQRRTESERRTERKRRSSSSDSSSHRQSSKNKSAKSKKSKSKNKDKRHNYCDSSDEEKRHKKKTKKSKRPRSRSRGRR